ncbi:ProQ/FINO family protein [Caenimonas terrae]|uniref:ProQ/FINO family protein n=1 Tax=Caenimonas terrae TaxID=696074 RepID=A0ABW0NF65_9BURK
MNDTASAPAPAPAPADDPAPASAAGIAAPTPAAPGPAAKSRPKAQQRKGPPRGKPAHPVLDRLFELHPQLFGAQFKPLKIGIFEDLLARHPDAFQREELKVALGLHARSTAYLESVAAGLQRHDLDGQPVAPLAPEHVHHAIMEVFRRRQQRTREDLRPRLMQKLVAAIEASGLSPAEYAEKMRTQDETNNALLQQAVAQLAHKSAKREALARAFAASGQSMEAFAEMYGMDLAQVKRTLG